MRYAISTIGFSPVLALAALCATAACAPRTGAPAYGAPIAAEPPPSDVSYLSPLEAHILTEMNLARTDPVKYASYIEALIPHFEDKVLYRPGRVPVETTEGVPAVREAVRALRAMQPVARLTPSRGLSAGARDHVLDQGLTGQTGHNGWDGSTAAERVSRYGRWDVTVSENIAYGPPSARDVVIGLIVDDGVKDRGHRQVMFNPSARLTGIACGRHPRFRQMCVITYAVSYVEGVPPPARPTRRGTGTTAGTRSR